MTFSHYAVCCSVSLSHCTMDRPVFCVPFSLCSGLVCFLCLFLIMPRLVCVSFYCAVGWPVSISLCRGLVCVLCLFLIVPLVSLCSVSLSHRAVGWSVFCVSFSSCRWLVCILSLSYFAVGWSVFCISFSLCRGLVYVLSLSHFTVGWSVFCVSFSLCRGLVYVLCLFLILPWFGLQGGQ